MKTMIHQQLKRLTLCLLLLLSMTFSHTSQAANQDNTSTKTFNIKSFSKLKVSSAFRVEFIHSSENKVIIETDAEAINSIVVNNSDDVVTIKLSDSNKAINTHTMKATVYGNSLTDIELTGAVSFKSDHSFNEKNMTLKISGASEMKIAVNTDHLNVETSGASKSTVTGKATTQTISTTGASTYDGKDCSGTDVDVEATGASKSIVNCAGHLKASADGASAIKYAGSPTSIDKNIGGASSLGGL